MQQYYINQSLESSLSINSDLYHYLKNVVKIRKDEEFYLFNGKKKSQYIVTNINIKNKNIQVVKQKDIDIQIDKYKIDLVIGLLKKDKIELVIQKTTELGINDIYLTNLTNNVVKFDKSKVDKKLARYNEIALNAVCQSKRNNLSKIKYIADKNKIKFTDYDYVYFLYEKEEDNTMVENLSKIENIENKKLLLICGPEGGFTEEEKEFFKQNSESISINNNILRAETAAIVAVGLIRGIKG